MRWKPVNIFYLIIVIDTTKGVPKTSDFQPLNKIYSTVKSSVALEEGKDNLTRDSRMPFHTDFLIRIN